MSEENDNRQNNGNGNNDWRQEIEANLARITKRLDIMNKLHLREEFRAAQARKEADERRKEADERRKEADQRMARMEKEAAEVKRQSDERTARIQETLEYLTRLVRALGDKTFEHDERMSQAGAILSGDSANRTGT